MQKDENWSVVHSNLSTADQERILEPNELETYALAAYLTGRYADSYEILERAHQSYLVRDQTDRASRCAFWLGLILINAGQRARGGGWIAKTERLLNNEQQQDGPEKGLLLLPKALGALSTGQIAKAQKLFEQAETIGERFGDIDLIALGRLGQGQTRILDGEMDMGIKLLDETMIIVETEEVFPIAKGIVYCAGIETCRKVWDLQRAKEWTLALTRWCNSQPDLVPFRGQCLVRRAEIIQFYGDWKKALGATEDACDLLTRPPGEPAAGEAYYRRADLLRLLGDFEEAEDCYREAAKWGRKPQPGLALLRLAQEQYDTAVVSIRNTLLETKDAKRRVDLLPAATRIMIATENIQEATEATKELSSINAELNSNYLDAMSSYCQGEVFLAEGRIQNALDHLGMAMKFWNMLDVPYESARTRELKGMAYRELDDGDNSNSELEAAKWIYQQLEARSDVKRINQLLKRAQHREAHGLTLRELQVLRQVVQGKTNKSVARELLISERTVDRHVSNIFNKLGVASRVEATTYAIRNKILDELA